MLRSRVVSYRVVPENDLNVRHSYSLPYCNVPALTSPFGQKDTSACELVATAAGSNICTLTLTARYFVFLYTFGRVCTGDLGWGPRTRHLDLDLQIRPVVPLG